MFNPKKADEITLTMRHARVKRGPTKLPDAALSFVSMRDAETGWDACASPASASLLPVFIGSVAGKNHFSSRASTSLNNSCGIMTLSGWFIKI